MEKISVIIVNWNVADSLVRCLDSIWATKYPNLEIIVIDNASSTPIHPQKVNFIQNPTNIGLPRAWNQGLQQATGDYILILNPDTRLPIDFFTQVLTFMKDRLDVGVMGPKFTNPDGTPQGSVFPEPSIIDTVREYWFGQKGLTQKYTPRDQESVSVNAVSGACLFLPKRIVDKIGKFTEEVFMYYEDLDYCRRIRAAGLRIVFNPQITIVHEHGQSSAKSGGATNEYHRQASLWYNGSLKHYLLWFIIWSSQKKPEILIIFILLALTVYRYLHLGSLDINQISTRRAYYPRPISRLLQNKLNHSFTLSRQQVFSVLTFDKIFRVLGYE